MVEKSKCLRKAERGAVMVMALFMAIFLVAVLYHLIGVGTSAVEHQMAQNATDSLTYSAAAVKARGMNTIAMINLVMAIVLAVLVAIRLVMLLVTVAMAAVSVACVFSGGAACGAIPPLVNVQMQLKKASNNLEDNIKPVLEGLAKVATVVNKVTSPLAEVEAIYISQKESQPVSQFGFVWPVVEALPTKEGTFDELCEQAGKQVGEVSMYFMPGDLPKKAGEVVGELIGELAGSFTSFFCGGGSSPSKNIQQDEAYPGTSDHSCDAAAAQPSERSAGGCNSAKCDRCAEEACTLCLPRMEGTDGQDASKFKKARWLVGRDQWVEVPQKSSRTPGRYDVRPAEDAVEWILGNPCEGKGVCGGEVICQNEIREAAPEYGATAVRVQRTMYRKMFSCVVEKDIALETPDPIDGSDWPKPRVVDDEAKPDDFRVWGIGLGANHQKNREDGVGRMYGLESDALLSERVTGASADFRSPSRSLWEINWYSRMIRFRFPKEGISEGGCSSNNAEICKQVGGKAKKLEQFAHSQIVH